MSNTCTEEECVRAESLAFLEDGTVLDMVHSRKLELTFTSGLPLHVDNPEVTSTPRSDRFEATPGRYNLRPLRKASVQLPRIDDEGHLEDHDEILRADSMINTFLRADTWDEDEDGDNRMEGTARDTEQDSNKNKFHTALPTTATTPTGLNLDPAAISALSVTLQKTIPGANTSYSEGTPTSGDNPKSSTPTSRPPLGQGGVDRNTEQPDEPTTEPMDDTNPDNGEHHAHAPTIPTLTGREVSQLSSARPSELWTQCASQPCSSYAIGACAGALK